MVDLRNEMQTATQTAEAIRYSEELWFGIEVKKCTSQVTSVSCILLVSEYVDLSLANLKACSSWADFREFALNLRR